MSQAKNIAVLVGSLRAQSYNRKVANALIQLAPPGLALSIVEIGQLPLYNQDYDEASPAAYTEFRQKIAAADGVLFVTPEHNRSMPAAMKNALDIASRPSGKSVWAGKPGAVISASPSSQGGFGANHHMRQPLVCLNVCTMPQPEAYLNHADKLFDEQGAPTAAAKTLLKSFIDAYSNWVARF